MLVLLGVAVLAATPVPAPVVVDEPAALPDGLSLGPAVARVEVPADGALVTHHLAVGSGGRAVLDLAVREVAAGTGGEPELGGPAEAVRLPTGTVTLDPGERATVTTLVHGPVEAPRLLALTATPRGHGEELVALVVALPPGTAAPVAPPVAAVLAGDVLTVTLEGSGTAHGTVDVRVRLSAPTGPAVLDETLPDVLVWPDRERELVWRLDLPPWPVPYTVEVVAGQRGGEVTRADATAWPPLRAWLPAAAVVLLALALTAWWLVRRRMRRTAGADAAGGRGADGGA